MRPARHLKEHCRLLDLALTSWWTTRDRLIRRGHCPASSRTARKRELDARQLWCRTPCCRTALLRPVLLLSPSEPVPEFAAYQAAVAAELADVSDTMPMASAEGHGLRGRSACVAQQGPIRGQGARHVRQASSTVPRTLIGASVPSAVTACNEPVDMSLVSRENRAVGYNGPGYMSPFSSH